MKAIENLNRLALAELRQKHPSVPEHALPIPKYSDNTSNGLTRCIVHCIEFNGHQAERINSTGRQIDNRQTVTDVIGRTRTIGSTKWVKGTGQTGTADISATIKGRSIKIEVKCKATGDNYQSQGQKDYQRKIEKSGGIYIIARTFEQFYTWYSKFVN